jgi:hypothetical protein
MRTQGTSRARSRRRVLALTAAAALTAASATACSSPRGAGAPASAHHTTAASAAAATAASSPSAGSSTAAAAAGLTGTWHGRYGGAYQGTFVLHWRQAGPGLSGNIHISNPSSTLPIHGSVTGGAIKFGTVGSYAITYSGSVSGNSMSGGWQINGPGQGGNWSASKG